MAAKRGEARQRILDSALQLVRENGAEAMSIEAVAAAAGSAKGLVHYHFKTKQGLLSAVAEKLAEQLGKGFCCTFRTGRG
jgi:TetR/AcrR family acrAB operon transcriptional repressor